MMLSGTDNLNFSPGANLCVTHFLSSSSRCSGIMTVYLVIFLQNKLDETKHENISAEVLIKFSDFIRLYF